MDRIGSSGPAEVEASVWPVRKALCMADKEPPALGPPTVSPRPTVSRACRKSPLRQEWSARKALSGSKQAVREEKLLPRGREQRRLSTKSLGSMIISAEKDRTARFGFDRSETTHQIAPGTPCARAALQAVREFPSPVHVGAGGRASRRNWQRRGECCVGRRNVTSGSNGIGRCSPTRLVLPIDDWARSHRAKVPQLGLDGAF